LAKIFKVNSTITELDLHYNDVGLQGTTALIFLDDNNIEDTGTVASAEAFKVNSIIREVELYDNIGDRGATVFEEVLKVINHHSG